MKHLLFLFAGLFVVSSCNNAEEFASLADEGIEEEQASETSQYRRDLQFLVEEEVEEEVVKIGGKKRQQIDITQTVGGKNLGKDTKKIVTNIEVTNIIVDSEDLAQNTQRRTKRTDGDMMEGGMSSQPSSKPKVDILFYMSNRDLSCIQNFSAKHKKGFLNQLDDLNWQVAFSYYSAGDHTALLPLELKNGEARNIGGLFSLEYDYTINRGEYSRNEAQKVFHSTLAPFFPEHNQIGRENGDFHLQDGTPNANKKVADPLSGLDHILSAKPEGVIRNNSQVIVFLLGYHFPYYSSESWAKFFAKHGNVSIVVMAERYANVSNMLHALEKEYDFEYHPSCSEEGAVDAIQSRVQ